MQLRYKSSFLLKTSIPHSVKSLIALGNELKSLGPFMINEDDLRELIRAEDEVRVLLSITRQQQTSPSYACPP